MQVTAQRIQESFEGIMRQLEKAPPKVQRDYHAPVVGIILGTGLGQLLSRVEVTLTVPCDAIPHMPKSTAPTHKGQLIFGKLSGKWVVVMDGRLHLYEGYSAAEAAYPVRILNALGVKTLLISNVSGGLNPAFKVGQLMVITDHLNLQGSSPLVGPNDDALGPRFPDMSQPYDLGLIGLAQKIGAERSLPMTSGVYAGVLGPQLETRAEYRWLRQSGADAVGMSTVPEVIAGVHAGLRILAVSLISDLCIPETLKPVTIDEIVAVANKAEPQLTTLFADLVTRL